MDLPLGYLKSAYTAAQIVETKKPFWFFMRNKGEIHSDCFVGWWSFLNVLNYHVSVQVVIYPGDIVLKLNSDIWS